MEVFDGYKMTRGDIFENNSRPSLLIGSDLRKTENSERSERKTAEKITLINSYPYIIKTIFEINEKNK